MTHPEPPPDAADGRIRPPVSEAAVRHLAEAIASLSNDSAFFIEALTEMLLAMSPVSGANLSANEVRFLIESGRFTREEWADVSAAVDKGSLQLSTTQWWLTGLLSTMSLEETSHYLGWSEESVLSAEAGGHLYGVEITGRMRYPTWQFDVGSPDRILPGLTEILQVLDAGWTWRNVAGFMSTPQSALVAEGRKTPVAWLRDGGTVDTVKQSLESVDWW